VNDVLCRSTMTRYYAGRIVTAFSNDREEQRLAHATRSARQSLARIRASRERALPDDVHLYTSRSSPSNCARRVLALSIHTSDPITMSMTLAEHVSPLERGSIFRKARPRSPESREENEETGCYPCVARSLQSARLFAERIVTPESLPLLATLLRDEHRCCSSTRVTFRAGLLCAITCREIRSISRLDRGPTDHTEIRST
jgi:hypothetical protein